jgi:hypothetical protein
MKLSRLTTAALLYLLFLCTPTWAQCPAGEQKITLEIDPDEYFEEVTWIVQNAAADIYFEGDLPADGLFIFDYCMPTTGCTTFRINDVFGDGMVPDGYYKLYVNDTLVYENFGGNYGYGESVILSCVPGAYCTTAFPLDSTGSYVTPTTGETWYAYTPVENGTYELNTCGSANTCPSKIWVYNRCENLVVTNNQTGASFYAADGCDFGAKATLFLAGGTTYYFRFASVSDSVCVPMPLHFELRYVGPVVGCSDPNACNYNPLASVSDTCYYPGDPLCANKPDLVILQDVLRESLELTQMNNPDACAVQEGCLRGTGQRWIINFSTHIKNIGNLDYYIGEPPVNINTPSTQFVFDPCHNHWHYRGYAEYLLYTADGDRLPIGTKNGFCVLDLECGDGGLGKFTCDNMGVTAQCGDIYDAGLPCQWVDITDLPAGYYTLVARVNWDKSPDKFGNVESTYENNWAQACFNLEYVDDVPVVDFLEDDCPQYSDCTGEIFGNQLVDCKGDCGGPALFGDITADTLRNNSDRTAYLTANLESSGTATPCTDLFEDGVIDLYDAALLQECTKHGDDLTYWGQRFPCNFPTGLVNTDEPTFFRLANIDTVAKTVEVQLRNPFSLVMGYEFRIGGLRISQVDNLKPAFHGDVQYSNATDKVAALAADETLIQKSNTYQSILRIRYDSVTANKICILPAADIVNNKYQRCLPQLDSCIALMSVGTAEAVRSNLEIYAQPNPFDGSFTLFFENETAEPAQVTLYDLTGKLLRQYTDIREGTLRIERGALPTGTYLYRVVKPGAWGVGRVVAK